MSLLELDANAHRQVRILHAHYRIHDCVPIGLILDSEGWLVNHQPRLHGYRGLAYINGGHKIILINADLPGPERRWALAWLYARWMLGETGLLAMCQFCPPTMKAANHPLISALACELLMPDAVVAATNRISVLASRCQVPLDIAGLRVWGLSPERQASYWRNPAEWAITCRMRERRHT